MDANVTTIIVAGIGASSGWLAFWRSQRKDAADHERTRKDDRRKAKEDVVSGFAELADDLRDEMKRREADCERRIRQVEKDAARHLENVKRDLLEEIVKLEGQLNGTR